MPGMVRNPQFWASASCRAVHRTTSRQWQLSHRTLSRFINWSNQYRCVRALVAVCRGHNKRLQPPVSSNRRL